jgi:hypothetical protein
MAFAPDLSTSYRCAAVPSMIRLVIGVADSATTSLATTELLDVATTSLATTELLDVATMEFAAGRQVRAVASQPFDAGEVDTQILVLGGGVSTTEVVAVDAQRGARATRHRH